MIIELDRQIEKKTWKIVEELPQGRKPLNSGWVYKVNTDGSRKSRLIVKGYAQIPGIDYGSTYAPTGRITTLRMLLAIAAKNNLLAFHFYVVTVYLHAPLDEYIYMY